jgi:hypothetical protein
LRSSKQATFLPAKNISNVKRIKQIRLIRIARKKEEFFLDECPMRRAEGDENQVKQKKGTMRNRSHSPLKTRTFNEKTFMKLIKTTLMKK